MLKAIVVAAALGAVCVSAASVGVVERHEFEAWAAHHGKSYATEAERTFRMEAYAANKEKVARMNAEARGRTTFALNKFADMPHEEFMRLWATGLNGGGMSHPSMPMAPRATPAEVAAVPTTWDWRLKGAVTPVKNQGQCGSCWSFSATGSIEGQWALAGNKLVGLSEQNLVDCSTKEGNMGCNGGLMSQAFEYVLSNKGIDSEASYPYTATGPNSCQFNRANVAATITNWTKVPHNEAQMKAFSYEHGPLSIAVDASTWQFYLGGVIYYPGCGTSLDHGVLIVGWGTETDIFGETMPYWIIKNSWGADWGESGYLKVEYKADGDECGVSQDPVSSLIPKKQ